MTEEEKKHQKELWKQDRIRERREEWEKIRSMGTGAKLQYFWDYYKIVLVFAAALILVLYLAVTMIQGFRMHALLYACFLNVEELDPDTETLLADYVEARGGKKKTEQIVFDSSVFIDPDSTGTTQQDVAAAIKITSYTGAGALDVFLAPPYVTAYEQESGMLMNLEDVLTKEEIKRLGDAGFLYYASEPETDRVTGELVQTEKPSVESAGAGKDETAQAKAAADDVRAGAGEDETAQAKAAADDVRAGAGKEETAQTKEYALNTRAGDGMHIYAVRIDPAGVIGRYDIYADHSQVWFSIIGNTPRSEEAVRFLHFLLAEEEPGTQTGS